MCDGDGVASRETRQEVTSAVDIAVQDGLHESGDLLGPEGAHGRREVESGGEEDARVIRAGVQRVAGDVFRIRQVRRDCVFRSRPPTPAHASYIGRADLLSPGRAHRDGWCEPLEP